MVEKLKNIKLKDLGKNKSLIAFICCMLISIVSISISSYAQSGFGLIDVQVIGFTGLDGENLVAKVYRPLTATETNKAPGILAIHGFNNDKDVYRPSAIELARAGFVVLCIDQNGHGFSDGSFEENWDNFGNSSYFAAWIHLKSLPYVDTDNLGAMGHSMGSLEIFFYFPYIISDCDAMVLETFSPGYYYHPTLNAGLSNYTLWKNVLHIWAEKEEFQLRSTTTLPDWIALGLGAIDAMYGLSGTANFDTTYNLTAGGWTDGSMRRHALIPTTHPGLTANPKAIAEKVAWFLQALQGKSEAEAWVIANPAGQVWIYSEAFGLIATLFLIMSILPLGVLLMRIKFFKDVNQPIPEKVIIQKKSTWWIFAAITAGVGAVTFLTFTYWLPQGFARLSGATSIIQQALTPLFNIGITSTIAIWLLVATGIGAVLFTIWYVITWLKKRKDISFYDMGVSYATKADKEGLSFGKRIVKSANPKILGKTILIALILFAWMYLWVFIADVFLKVSFRGIWSLLTTFTVARFIRFWVYLIPTLLFFLVIGGVLMLGEMRMKEKDSGIKTQAVWWFKVTIAILGGLVVIILMQYVPMWFGRAPFFNISGVPGLENFAQHYPLMELLLMLFIPLFAVLIFVMIFFYRKTGKIYLGAIICSFIAVWISVISSCMYI